MSDAWRCKVCDRGEDEVQEFRTGVCRECYDELKADAQDAAQEAAREADK